MKGYNQLEGINFNETYAYLAKLEAIRIILAFSCILNFKILQMDVKNMFLNSYIQGEVYVDQPPRFKNFSSLNHVFKLKRDFYNLKHAPRARYDCLRKFMIENYTR